jgi:hypothetical protein
MSLGMAHCFSCCLKQQKRMSGVSVWWVHYFGGSRGGKFEQECIEVADDYMFPVEG